jgi:hypothetical protein
MNPWEILLAGLGWCLVGLLVFVTLTVAVAFVSAVVVAMVRSFRSSRRPRTHRIMKSDPQ